MSLFLPDLADLRLLVRSVDLGSFSAVAREHGVTVSAVTRAVDRLERGYAASLLRRSTHGLSATPEGRQLAARSRELLDDLHELGSVLTAFRSGVRGTVRIAVSAAMCEELLLPHIGELAREHPDLRLEFLADDRIVDLVTDGIDLALRSAVGNSEGVIARELGAFGRRLYAAPAYLRSRGTPALPEDLQRHVLVTYSSQGTTTSWPLRTGDDVLEVPVRSSMAANSTALVLKLLVAGHGIGLLSQPVAASAVARDELVEVLADHPAALDYRLYAVSLPGRHGAARIKAVVAFLERLARTRWSLAASPATRLPARTT